MTTGSGEGGAGFVLAGVLIGGDSYNLHPKGSAIVITNAASADSLRLQRPEHCPHQPIPLLRCQIVEGGVHGVSVAAVMVPRAGHPLALRPNHGVGGVYQNGPDY